MSLFPPAPPIPIKAAGTTRSLRGSPTTGLISAPGNTRGGQVQPRLRGALPWSMPVPYTWPGRWESDTFRGSRFPTACPLMSFPL